MKKRSQVSVEYALVIGFSLLLIIPIIILFYENSGYLNDRVNMNQAHSIARKIVDTSESVYYLGAPTFSILKLSMPDKINNITIGQNEFVFNIETSTSNTEIVQISAVNITGTLNTDSGLRRIRIQAYDNYVNISDS